MAALQRRCGHYIFALCVGFFYLLSFFLAYSQPSQIWCLPYFHTWCGLSVNLGCRSETCCTRLAENIGRKNRQKIRHLRTIAQIRRAISSQLMHIINNRKNLLNSNISPHMSSQYGVLQPTIAAKMAFSAIFSSFDVPQYSNLFEIDWIMLNTYDQQFALTTKKSFHVIFKYVIEWFEWRWTAECSVFCLGLS